MDTWWSNSWRYWLDQKICFHFPLRYKIWMNFLANPTAHGTQSTYVCFRDTWSVRTLSYTRPTIVLFPTLKTKTSIKVCQTFTDPWWNEKSKDNIVSFHKVQWTELPYILRLCFMHFFIVKISFFYKDSILVLSVAF